MSGQEHLSPSSTTLRKIFLAVLVLFILIILLVTYYAWPALQARFSFLRFQASSSEQTPISAVIDATLAARVNNTVTLSAIASSTLTPTSLPDSQNPPTNLTQEHNLPSYEDGLIILSIGEKGFIHLFAYRSEGMPFIRLTSGPWHDITPALSPDGTQLAFSSDRDGYWDLYMMELESGKVTQLTYTPEYEAYPTWSPDGLWLAYERYMQGDGDPNGNLDIFVCAANDPQSEPIRLTSHPGADHSPAWSPLGRKLAIISTRSGENEVWLVDLDQTGDRLENISRNVVHTEVHPVWSPDGGKLAWAATDSSGFQSLYIWDTNQADTRPSPLNGGDWSAWNPEGKTILASLKTPNRFYLSAYDLAKNGLALPLFLLSGSVHGMTWGRGGLLDELPDAFAAAAQVTVTPAWVQVLQPGGDLPGDRRKVVPLEGVDAPDPILQDSVDEAYYALRERLINDVGWDYLAVLEETFLPLTSPLEPGMQEDWLYTGRGIRINTAPLNAGWLVAVREDYGAKTFWRLYVKTRFQDGSQGAPLKELPWDFNARQSGDPLTYMRGGTFFNEIPEGYWIDLTELAAAYGWKRQPALSTWRIAYSAARYNAFFNDGGLDWFSAMLEIYPREALNTPTPVSSPTASATTTETSTPTETSTRTPYLSPTATTTNTATATRTPRPTNTPWSTATRPATDTPRYSATPEPSPSTSLGT